jgi:dTDP-4-amino-4,6-dideoxygalactose transaminase
MSVARGLLNIWSGIATNVNMMIRGIPITFPSLGSMTLDRDDVCLAKTLLANDEEWYDMSPLKMYENKFRQWNGSKHAFAFMSGRVALSACIYALGLKPGDEVIIPGYTCVAVPNAFNHAGIKLIYSDIELDTHGLDINCLSKKITRKTKAILIHHLFGLVSRDYAEILALANSRGLKVIEDCAHATGAEFKDRKVGNYGDVAFYSSEISKVFNTIQGGLAVTNNDEFAHRIEEYYRRAPVPDPARIKRQLYNVILNYYLFKDPQRRLKRHLAELIYGKYRLISTTDEEIAGTLPKDYGQRMVGAIALLGINQLNKIDFYNEDRRKMATKWDVWCEDNGYRKPLVLPDSRPVFLRYPVLVEPVKKQDTTWALLSLKIKPGVWFTGKIHPADINVADCPNADESVKKCINFPCLVPRGLESR